MSKAAKKRGRKPGSKTRFSGIIGDAESLGISATHLWLVLTDQRQSESLLARYRRLRRGKRATNVPSAPTAT